MEGGKAVAHIFLNTVLFCTRHDMARTSRTRTKPEQVKQERGENQPAMSREETYSGDPTRAPRCVPNLHCNWRSSLGENILIPTPRSGVEECDVSGMVYKSICSIDRQKETAHIHITYIHTCIHT